MIANSMVQNFSATRYDKVLKKTFTPLLATICSPPPRRCWMVIAEFGAPEDAGNVWIVVGLVSRLLSAVTGTTCNFQ